MMLTLNLKKKKTLWRIFRKNNENISSNNNKVEEDFKHEIINRLVLDEKKFGEINENFMILDKNITILSEKNIKSRIFFK